MVSASWIFRPTLGEGLALLAELQLDHRFLNPFVNVYKQACRASCRSLSERKVQSKADVEREVRAGFQGGPTLFFGPGRPSLLEKAKLRAPSQDSRGL